MIETDLTLSGLPVTAVLPELCQRLSERDEAVLVAPPGAGKTTLCPIALMQQQWLSGGERQKILVLQPRRLAARLAAERMAHLLGETVGQSVGYRVRLESRVSQHTRIEVITEGILTRLLQDDPALQDVGLLIFDEFHERSLDADLGLALALQGRELFGELRRQPLKLLLMSATLDSDSSALLLADANNQPAPVVISEGRRYPVEIHYSPPRSPGEWIVPPVVDCVLQALECEPGSVLVFLPGQGEIRAVEERLQSRLAGRDDIIIAPLYGDLNLQQQQRAIEPAATGKRKITLATSIAETSLTIEGVRIVVDSGLARLPEFDPASGMSRLQTRQLSRAAATQRCGRAGRLEPGVCWRLWSESQQQQLRPFTPAEILNADLAPLALQLLRWGVTEPSELRWLDPPPGAAWQQALDLLQRLGALESLPGTGQNWRLSPHGEAMARLPTHPRLAHLLLEGNRLGLRQLAADIAALLSDRDIGADGSAAIQTRLELLRGERQPDRGQRGPLRRLQQQARQFLRLLHPAKQGSVPAERLHERWVGCLLASAYPDRIAKKRNHNSWQLSGGRAVQFRDIDALQRHEWLVVAHLSSRRDRATDRIDLATAFDPELLQKELAGLVTPHDIAEWSEESDKFVAEQQRRIGVLVVERQATDAVPDAVRRQCLLDLVRKRGLQLLPWTDALRQWQQRVELLRSTHTGDPNPWPDVSDAGLMQQLEDWLLPYLEPVNRLTDFKRLDLRAILGNLLAYPLAQQLEALAPTHYTVPSGSRLRIDYSAAPPVLAVKLQEMFGCRTTPVIANGQVRLVLHLLSPAQRPLQVTQDLAGFWSSSYLEVKKEMRGRYPKHQWPDDPLQATATARTTRPRKDRK